MFQLFRTAIGLGAAAATLGATLPTAEAQPAASHAQSCFRTNQIENTRMVDSRMLYIRTSAHTYFRMDFFGDCDSESNGPLIIHPVDNSDEVCGASGIDVHIRETGQECMPSKLTKLTPAEVAAIPKKDLP
jgi:hypothetical protein